MTGWTYEGAMRRWREVEIPAADPVAYMPYWPFCVPVEPAPPTVERVYQRLLWLRTERRYEWTTVDADTYYHG